MANSLYPKALIYKEWKQKRWAAIVVLLLICPSVYLQTLTPLNEPDASVVMVNNFADWCNSVDGHYTAGWWASIVVIGLALYSLWTERHSNVWQFTLSGPVRKQDVLRVKFTFDILLIITVFTFFALSLYAIDLSFSLNYPLIGVIRWWFAEIVIQTAMYALALLLGTLIGNVLFAGMLAYGIAKVPGFAFAILGDRLSPLYLEHHPGGMYALNFLAQLSPLGWFNHDLSNYFMPQFPLDSINTYTHFACYLLWVALAYILADLLYRRTQNERMTNFLVYPVLRHPLGALVAAICGLLSITIFTGRDTAFGDCLCFVLVTAFVWFVIHLVTRPLLRRL